MNDTPRMICSRCVLDDTVPDLKLDPNGVCNYCKIHDELEQEYPLNESGQQKLKALIDKIKQDGQGKPYDCIIGVSGGRDSTYALYMAHRLGLRPLAVHFDNGWNSDIAVTNIKNALDKLNIELYTYVVDWEEFKDLQISFLKASTSDAEIPTDIGLTSTLYRIADQENIKYIITGNSFRTEGFAPPGWTWLDGRYIRNVQKRFGSKKLKSYPNLTMSRLCYYMFVKRIQFVPLLYYVKYDKKEVGPHLEHELGWQYYGAHHHENIYTKFFQSYYLVQKFGIDKRKTEYSAYIRSGQMKREDALRELKEVPYDHDEDVVKYTIEKLGLTQTEFDQIMAQPKKSFKDYPSYFPLLKASRPFLRVAYGMSLIPKALYLRFLGV